MVMYFHKIFSPFSFPKELSTLREKEKGRRERNEETISKSLVIGFVTKSTRMLEICQP